MIKYQVPKKQEIKYPVSAPFVNTSITRITTQEGLKAYIEATGIKRGDWVTHKYQSAGTVDGLMSISYIADIQEDVNKVRGNAFNNHPEIFYIFPADPRATYIRWGAIDNYRKLTQQEIDTWLTNANDQVQSSIKHKLFTHGFSDPWGSPEGPKFPRSSV